MAFKRSLDGQSAARQAVNFLGVSILSGVVLAGIALPAVGAIGLGVKDTAEGFDELPGGLKQPPLSQASRILDSRGNEIATVYSRDRTVVDLDDIAKPMQQAIIAIEDARFYEHGAVDPQGILRALNENAESGEVAQGASTLTQQYVKNVFVEQAGDDKEALAAATQQRLGRKIKELKYAIQLEQELSKKKILENYLNITFFGQQAYGVEAASKRYFSKSAKDLELTEAALLAGIVQSPSRYDPVNDEKEATRRRNVVLARMAGVGAITQAEAAKAKKEPLGLNVSAPKNGCITAADGAGFFCDYVHQLFLSDPTFGKTRKERIKRWDEGGLTIRTTLDPQSQKAVQAGIKKRVFASDEIAAASTLVEPGTGKILAMGQSRPYGFTGNQTQINYSVDKSMGGGVGFQPGSTFKPFTAAAALEKGMSPTQVYPSPYSMPYPTVRDCEGNVYADHSTVPNEREDEVGPYSMTQAMKLSVNTYFVALEEEVGLCEVLKITRRLGIEKRAGGDDLGVGAAYTLGVNEMSPLTMASAYAAFASRGVYCRPRAIESITDADGKKLPVPQRKCGRAMSEKTADTVNTMLRGVVESGTGRPSGLSDRPNAGKTGTTDERRAAWFVGYTPNLSAAVWMGDPKHERKMIDITIGGAYFDKVTSSTGPAPVWREVVSEALRGKPVQNFVTVDLPRPASPGDDEGEGDGDDEGDNNNPDPRPENPFPDFSLPPGFIGGGGNGGGHGNGGGRG